VYFGDKYLTQVKSIGYTFLVVILLAGCRGPSSVKLFARGSAPTTLLNDSVAFTREARLIIVPVVINGRTYRFLFDTGAPMLVSTELAQELGLKKVARKNVRDSQNLKQKLDFVALPNLTIGNTLFTDLVAVASDLTTAPAIGCMKIDGLIGANLMRLMIWNVDYQNQFLSFTNDFEGFKADTTALVLPFVTTASGSPKISLVVGSDSLKSVTFDTGSGGGLSYSKQSASKSILKKAPHRSSYGYHSQGIFGATPDTLFYATQKLSIGDTSFPDFMSSVRGQMAKALLGTQFFEHFEMVLNWREKKVYLSPNAQQIQQQKTARCIHPYYVDGKIYVGNVLLNSAASNAGIEVMDEIVSVNGKQISPAGSEDYCAILTLWRTKNAHIEVEILGKGKFIVVEESLISE